MAVLVEEEDAAALPAGFTVPRERLSRGKMAIVAFATVCAVLWLVPFYYLAISIFKTTEEYAHTEPLSFPAGLAPLLNNVRQAWVSANMGEAFFNSALYGIVGASLAVLFASM